MNKGLFQTLAACLLALAASAQTVNVTFRVDLSKVAGAAASGAHFAGTPNSWNPQPMTPLGGGQFELTLPVAENSAIEYKFLDGPNNFEPDAALPACGTPNGNRSLTTGTADVELPTVCFGECSGCKTKLFVSVDMSGAGAIDPAGVFAADASGTDWPLTDGGNGTWSGSIDAPNFSTIKYVFKNGAAAEPTADLSACGTANGSGGFWRSAAVSTQDVTAPVVCFGQCGGCPVACSADPNGLICENFNGLSAGPVGPQLAYFSGQNGIDGGPEDPSVSAAQSSDGGQSLHINGDNSGGATPGSTVLRLGNQASGKFDLRWKMFFIEGKTGFFNIDADEAGFGPIVTVVVSPDGEVYLVGPTGEPIGATYATPGVWTDFRLLVDVSGGRMQLRIGQGFSQNLFFNSKLGGLHFIGLAVDTEFFVDEIEFRKDAVFSINLDDCPQALDLSPFLNGPGTTTSTPLFDNTGATAEVGLAGTGCFTEDDFGGTDEVQNSLWYKFKGNGRVYQIQTAPCDAGAAYLDGGDTQMAAYIGESCSNLVPIGCNDDLGVQFTGDFRSGVVIATEPGNTYRLMVDGFDGTEGKFCLQLTQFQRITFRVDASNIALDPQGMFIQGSWDGWAAPIDMKPLLNNIWWYSIDLPPGAIIEWKYQNGPGGWEADTALAACGVANGLGGFNRTHTVVTDETLATVCFGSCDACPPVNHWYNECAYAEDLTGYLGQGTGVVVNTPLFTNEDATAGPDDPTEGFDCWFGGDGVDNSVFFKFLGDGGVYKISTSDCGSTNYIVDGDTQFAIYEGDDCQFGPSIACNDDLDPEGIPDYRAGLTFSTEAGKWYTLLVDGWGGAQGEFCFEIEQVEAIGCAQAVLGEAESDTLSVCLDETGYVLINGATTVVPNIGPVAGFTYVISLFPFPPGFDQSPVGVPGYFGSTGLATFAYELPIQNDGSAPPGIYVITPLLVSGATTNPGAADPLDATGGCFIYGPPIYLVIVPGLDPIEAIPVATPATTPPGGNGAIDLSVSGGSGQYQFSWSNGAETEDLTGLAAGLYHVTITDITGCVETVLTINVPSVVGTGEGAAGIAALSVLPNPTTGPLHFSLQMIGNQPVSVRLVNALGQLVASQKFDGGGKIDGSFDLAGQPGGVFCLQFETGGRTVERKVVLVK